MDGRIVVCLWFAAFGVLLILIAVLTGGCVAPQSRVGQAGGDADNAAVIAKLKLEADRIVGVNKEVQASVNNKVDATRDAINRNETKNTSGLESWPLVAIVFIMMAPDIIRALRGVQA